MKPFARPTSTAAVMDPDGPPPETAASRTEIGAVLRAYEAALNAADVDAIVSVFADDGVFMPQYGVAAVGTEAVRAAYRGVFSIMAFETRLQVEEIVPVSPDWAFARTTSAGAVTFQANGRILPDANHELFVFQKTAEGAWKIARYCFSTTNPPRQ